MRKVLLLMVLAGMFMSQSVSADLSDDMREEMIKEFKEHQEKMLAKIPTLEDKSVDGWNAEMESFDYKLPCDATLAPYSAIIAQGTNRMDLLTEDEDGEYTYERDVSIGYPRMEEFCIALAQPKSGLSTVENAQGEPEKWRTWWLSEEIELSDEDWDPDNWAPIRDEDNEIAATIAVLKLAKKSLGKPTYLVMGNDLGVLTAKIIQKLGEDGEIDVIDGFIYVNRETGEFRRYNRDGSIWKSADNTPPAAAALARHDKRMRGLVDRDDSSPTYTLSRSEQ